MNACETCAKRKTCTRPTGIIFGGCAVDYVPDDNAIYRPLDNLEGCEDTPVYAAESRTLHNPT